MKRRPHPSFRRYALCLGLTLGLWAGCAQADDLDQLLAEKGLLARVGERVSQAGAAVRDKASELVVNSMSFLGMPYRRGGSSVDSGFDCSGFVRAMYEQSAGLLLPRKASDQAASTYEIAQSDLKPGDLVFYNTMSSAYSHVGIYVGDNRFIHSPKPGAKVRVEDMRKAYWESRFDGARRVAGVNALPEPANPPLALSQ